MLSTQRCPYASITVAAVIGLKDVVDCKPRLCILVRALQTGSMIKVGAACKVKFGKEFWQRVGLSQGINQPCLLPIGQKWEVDAQAFF